MASRFQTAQGKLSLWEARCWSAWGLLLPTDGCLHLFLQFWKGTRELGHEGFCPSSGAGWERKGRNCWTNTMPPLSSALWRCFWKGFKPPWALFLLASNFPPAHRDPVLFLLSYVRFLPSLRLINSTPSDSLAFLTIKVVGFLKKGLQLAPHQLQLEQTKAV